MSDIGQSRRHVYSIAIAIEQDDGRLLCGLRNPSDVCDYRGFWSIPSTSVSESEYRAALADVDFSSDLLGALQSRIGAAPHVRELITHGERIRTSYHLHQAVFRASLDGPPAQSSFKYETLAFLRPQEFLKHSGGDTGTCVSLYLQHLIDSGVLPSTFPYREVPPEIADGTLDPARTDSATLWRMAAPNYALMLQGRTGTDGSWIRHLSLDRFMERTIDELVASEGTILDVGCGDGRLVARAAAFGIDAVGIDLGSTYSGSETARIICGDVLDATRLVDGKHFDLVTASLLLEWVEDLPAAFRALAQCVAENGCLLATFTPPDFSHAGSWTDETTSPVWRQTKSPRRDPELVMINRCVGPIRYYPRSTAQIVAAAAESGLATTWMRDLYLDSMLSAEELHEVLADRPALRRHLMLPLFTIMEFSLSRVASTSHA